MQRLCPHTQSAASSLSLHALIWSRLYAFSSASRQCNTPAHASIRSFAQETAASHPRLRTDDDEMAVDDEMMNTDDERDNDTRSSTSSLSSFSADKLAAHQARIRAYRQESRTVRSFMSTVQEDLPVLSTLRSCIDDLCTAAAYDYHRVDVMKQKNYPYYYLATRVSPQFCVTQRVLKEVIKRVPLLQARTRVVLDMGFNTGSTAWTVAQVFKQQLQCYIAVEESSALLNLGKQSTQELGLPFRFLPRLLSTPAESVDLAIAGYGLRPLGKDHRRDMLQLMWESLSPGGVLVLIEDGSAEGFEVIRSSREFMLDKYKTKKSSNTHHNNTPSSTNTNTLAAPFVAPHAACIVAPCGHDNVCPQGKAGVCDFAHRLLWSSLPVVSPYKRIRSTDVLAGIVIEKFSYVVIHKGPIHTLSSNDMTLDKPATDATTTAAATHPTTPLSLPLPASFYTSRYNRILAPPLTPPKQVILDLCTTEGKLERWTLGKKAAIEGGYLQAKAAKWGDLWQFRKTITKRQLRKQRVRERAESRQEKEPQQQQVTLTDNQAQQQRTQNERLPQQRQSPSQAVGQQPRNIQERDKQQQQETGKIKKQKKPPSQQREQQQKPQTLVWVSKSVSSQNKSRVPDASASHPPSPPSVSSPKMLKRTSDHLVAEYLERAAKHTDKTPIPIPTTATATKTTASKPASTDKNKHETKAQPAVAPVKLHTTEVGSVHDDDDEVDEDDVWEEEEDDDEDDLDRDTYRTMQAAKLASANKSKSSRLSSRAQIKKSSRKKRVISQRKQ